MDGRRADAESPVDVVADLAFAVRRRSDIKAPDAPDRSTDFPPR
jgi:hypothetical protein